MREFSPYGVLGPVGPYDKGVLLFDGFEGADVWVKTGTGTDYVWELVSGASFTGAKGLQAKTKQTTPADGDYVQGVRTFPFPYRRQIFTRLRFLLWTIAYIDNFMIRLDLYDGIKQRACAYKYVPATPAFQYLNALGTWSSLGALAMNFPQLVWQQVDFSIDLSLNQYSKVWLSGKMVDMSTIGYYEVGVTTERKATITLYLECAASTYAAMWVEDIFIGEHVAI